MNLGRELKARSPQASAPGTGAPAEVPGLGRVLHVLNGFPYGGNETLCYQLMVRLPSRRRLLLNIGPDGPMRASFESLPGLQLFGVPYQRVHRARFVWQLTGLFRRMRPDAIIVYPFGMHVLVALAGRLAGVRRILVHAGNPVPVDEHSRRLWRWIVFASRLLRTPIFSCSRYVHDEFLRRCRELPAASRPIFNGIDVQEVLARSSAARSVRKDHRPTVGMVARLSVIKDQETLIRSMAEVRKRHADVQLWIVGEGETAGRLMAVVKELGLEGEVVFLGKRGDIPEILGQLDVYVFSTTRDEGFGIAIAEALAAGLPVVASDVPACRELLDESGGLLVPARDPRAMAGAILALLDDEALRERVRSEARQRVEEFSVARCAKEWLHSLRGER